MSYPVAIRNLLAQLLLDLGEQPFIAVLRSEPPMWIASGLDQLTADPHSWGGSGWWSGSHGQRAGSTSPTGPSRRRGA